MFLYCGAALQLLRVLLLFLSSCCVDRFLSSICGMLNFQVPPPPLFCGIWNLRRSSSFTATFTTVSDPVPCPATPALLLWSRTIPGLVCNPKCNPQLYRLDGFLSNLDCPGTIPTGILYVGTRYTLQEDYNQGMMRCLLFLLLLLYCIG